MPESRGASEARSQESQKSSQSSPMELSVPLSLSTDWVRAIHTRKTICFPQLTNSNVNVIQKHPHKTPGIMFNQIVGHEVKLTHRIKPSQSLFVRLNTHLQNSSTKLCLIGIFNSSSLDYFYQFLGI